MSARNTLEQITHEGDEPFMTTYYAIRQGWDRLVRRAGIKNLKFYDLRHEAISRLFEYGLNLREVGVISGHKDPRVLFRYTHPHFCEIMKKFNLKYYCYFTMNYEILCPTNIFGCLFNKSVVY